MKVRTKYILEEHLIKKSMVMSMFRLTIKAQKSGKALSRHREIVRFFSMQHGDLPENHKTNEIVWPVPQNDHAMIWKFDSKSQKEKWHHGKKISRHTRSCHVADPMDIIMSLKERCKKDKVATTW